RVPHLGEAQRPHDDRARPQQDQDPAREVPPEPEEPSHVSLLLECPALLSRPATTMPASQPGARPPGGGRRSSVSRPARTSSQEISELEFHMSPVCSSSRPHTGGGTGGTRSRTRCAGATSFATRIGPPTAAFASGMAPPRHRRIS